MNHPGSRLSAFVDRRLGIEEAERVMAHVAVCGQCAAELAGERQARRRLSTAGDVAPGPDLTARLLALRPPDPSAAHGSHRTGRPVPTGGTPRRWSDTAGFAGSVPLPGEPAPAAVTSLRGEVEGRRRAPLLLGVAGCLALLLAGLVALDDRPPVSPQVHRAYALRVLAEAIDAGHGVPGASAVTAPSRMAAAATLPSVRVADVPGTTGRHADGTAGTAGTEGAAGAAGAADTQGVDGVAGEVVLSGAAAHAGAQEWLTRNGWVAPGELPHGWTVEAVRLDVHGPGDLEMDITGPLGTVVVLQQRGRLAPAAVEDLPTIEVAGRDVHIASRDPWHVVWQCGHVVVSVVAEGHATAVREVVAVHPDLAYDDGVPARISRGWAVLAGAWPP